MSRYLTGIIPVHKLNIVILHGYIPSAHVISMENFTPSNYPQKYVGLAHVFKTMFLKPCARPPKQPCKGS